MSTRNNHRYLVKSVCVWMWVDEFVCFAWWQRFWVYARWAAPLIDKLSDSSVSITIVLRWLPRVLRDCVDILWTSTQTEMMLIQRKMPSYIVERKIGYPWKMRRRRRRRRRQRRQREEKEEEAMLTYWGIFMRRCDIEAVQYALLTQIEHNNRELERVSLLKNCLAVLLWHSNTSNCYVSLYVPLHAKWQ